MLDKSEKTYSNLISHLLIEENKQISEDIVRISFYIDLDQASLDSLEEKIQSKLRKGLTQNVKLRKEDKIKVDLKDKVLNQLEEIEKLGEGLGIFIEINLNKQNISVQIKNFYRSPVENIFIGQIFDLEQLVWLDQNNANSLIINFHKTKSQIYKLKEDRLVFIDEYENKLITDENYQNKDKETISDFFSFVEKELKDTLKNNKFEFIFVFYSTHNIFKNKALKESFKRRFAASPIFIARTVIEKAVLKEVALRRIGEARDSRTEDLISLAKSNEEYVEGWEEVLEAVREEKVKTLFLKPNIKRKGYKLEGNYIYTYPERNSSEVDNIIPWIIKFTLENNGKVKLIRDNDGFIDENIAAQLKYTT